MVIVSSKSGGGFIDLFKLLFVVFLLILAIVQWSELVIDFFFFLVS